jgi:hypothetical protein
MDYGEGVKNDQHIRLLVGVAQRASQRTSPNNLITKTT